MTMQFCKECGKPLKIVEKAGINIGICTCGSIQQDLKEISSGESKTRQEKGKGVLENEKEQGFPNKCVKCGYDEAYVVDLGAPFSDESNVYLFKCVKCGYVTRQADGTSNR